MAAREWPESALGRRRGCSSKGRLTDPKPAVGVRLRIFPLTPPHPTFPAWSGASESGGIQTFRPHRASNRLDGSRSESGKPARHIGAIAFILGSEAFAEPRLLNGNYPSVKKEPEQRAVAEEMPVSE